MIRPGTSELDRNAAMRRRLVKAGLVAAPFIVTLKAMPLRASSGSLGVYDYDGGGDPARRGRGRKKDDD